MDTVTDLLSTFFVSNNELVRKSKRASPEVRAKKNTDKKLQGPEVKGKVDKETQVDDNPSKEKSEEKLPVKRSSLSVLIDDLVADTEGSTEESTEGTTDGASTESLSLEESTDEVREDPPPKETVINLKKFILKAVEFGKRNMVIIGEDIEDSIMLLSDILHKLSLMKDVEKQYNKRVYVVTGDNKKSFKKMILENPYLYFVDFDVKAKLKRDMRKDIQRMFEEDRKKSIIIFDGASDACVVEGAHTIILCKPNEDLADIMEQIGENALVIFKPGRYKMTHKKFYKNNVQGTGVFRDFEEYYKVVSNEDVDIRYLVVRNNELRYI